ncbi:MAG: undecaprenyl-phosphate glucose phosphotransferase [Candidatus Omnitrophica bacterium CG11_big_fil_rev_8_21_14_0_20_45_26]|uniref:Undecaprenyl-phosphate glucose phosphotransferase n=1 Tax=Candidatus Abzuiibacterium crystallinum TaxID=1974748 RepID=A0A2H0LSD6_9BACT|nr:MAG: undecaprenyl-phosphate glucose phosphotransferase [Candidatus Omnitrophica bacterium CG11_big_fil_rev_8_21_14_0_20_45_26]PIW65058.1 MAG: undecaprenyl-phosphate glucose phosphotransferase [Candidatus Omnitrophica bacterium CG12_big_fil_rev_8_21_14_0_65_45_16]
MALIELGALNSACQNQVIMKTIRYRKKRRGDFVSALIFTLSDASAIITAFLLAYCTRFFWLPQPYLPEPPDLFYYFCALPIVVLIFLLTFHSHGIYIFDNLRRRLQEIFIVIKATLISSVLIMALTFIYRDFSYSRLVFILHCIFLILLVCLFRHFAYAFDGWVRRLMGTRIKVLIMGANRSAKHVIQRINRHYRNRYEVIGVLTGGRSSADKKFEGVQIVGILDDIFAKIPAMSPDEIILTVSDFPDEKLTELFLKCENELITFLKIPDLFGIFTSGVEVQYIDDVPLIGIKKSPLDKTSSRFLKRIFDMALSLLGLILLSPLFLMLALLVKLTDPSGPIFYKQRRTGMDGRSFWIYKFRTMKKDAEAQSGPVWAIKNDQRTTVIGKYLRQMNLDEIPQLWNTLKGEMSLVGPRPERPHFVGKFRKDIPRYMVRHKIKSGITGWAQVNGLRGNTSIEERTKLDLYYYENWSLLLDFKIIFMTLFSFKNAY